MMMGTLEATVDVLGHDSSLEVRIDYCATPGEEMVRYYSDGTGHPGAPPEAELLRVYVTRWDVGGEERARNEHWAWGVLDRIALERIDDQWDSRFVELCIEDASIEGQL